MKNGQNKVELTKAETETETVKAEMLTFDCALLPQTGLSIPRKTLVDFVQTEHRSYAAFPATMTDSEGIVENAFDLPEVAEKYGKSGLKVAVVVYLEDNKKGAKRSKTRKAL
jgi:hypothetical protein